MPPRLLAAADRKLTDVSCGDAHCWRESGRVGSFHTTNVRAPGRPSTIASLLVQSRVLVSMVADFLEIWASAARPCPDLYSVTMVPAP